MHGHQLAANEQEGDGEWKVKLRITVTYQAPLSSKQSSCHRAAFNTHYSYAQLTCQADGSDRSPSQRESKLLAN